jgi:PHP family Zn ribbon phosphoesterase
MADPTAGATETTTIGYVNRKGQIVVRATGLPGSDHGQYIYVLRCSKCQSEYGANGSDIFQRLCPKCQGGRPGLAF